MVFASIAFLFAFLPLCLLVYHVLPARMRNGALLAASLFFYAWGEGRFVAVLLASALANWAFGMRLESAVAPRARRANLAVAIGLNLALLFTYKYATFLLDNWNALLGLAGANAVPAAPVHLPIGISFFTFQAISYQIDVYRRDAATERSPVRLALYIALFPQLIAGPIVRYRDIAAQLVHRVVDLPGFARGVERFVVGLAKKVLVANTLAVAVDRIFALPTGALSAELAWAGITLYTLQIYFDFSGYSDMAIGLGRMFGFRFAENFDYPYVARSVTEFWRRWHISLSTWFRDYLYIPLGGNRRTAPRTYANLLTVFVLCGLWHGASWTFVAWGMFHGAFLVLERAGWARVLDRLPAFARHAYLLLVVLSAWALFRADSLDHALGYWAALFGAAPAVNASYPLAFYVGNEVVTVAVLAALGATPLVAASASRLRERASWAPLSSAAATCVRIGLLVLSTSYLVAGTHNPFIYFRF